MHYYYCATWGYLPITNLKCTKHNLIGQAVVSQYAVSKSRRLFASIIIILDYANANKDILITPNKGPSITQHVIKKNGRSFVMFIMKNNIIV